MFPQSCFYFSVWNFAAHGMFGLKENYLFIYYNPLPPPTLFIFLAKNLRKGCCVMPQVV